MARRWALPCLVAALAAGCGEPDSPKAGVGDRYQYLYVEPLKRFFAPAKDEQGGDVYRVDRLGAVEASLPLVFPRKKETGKLRVFVVGGSVAQLFNEGELKDRLESVLPDHAFEILDCGMSAYDSYRDSLVVEEVLDYDPDLIVLMSGSDDGERGWSSDPLSWRRVVKGLLRGLVLGSPLRAWRLVRTHLGDADPSRLAVEFEANVSRILSLARDRRVPVVLCALPWNFRDMPPRGWPPIWDADFFEAWRRFERGEFARSAELFRSLPDDPPSGGVSSGKTSTVRDRAAGWKRRRRRAFRHYYLARSLEMSGDVDGAQRHYAAAVDEQVPPLPAINRVVRRLGGEHDVPVADLERVFLEAAPDGLPGFDFFEDDMHWERWCDGMVAAAITEAVVDAVLWRGTRILAPAEAWDAEGLAALKADRAATRGGAARGPEKSWAGCTRTLLDQAKGEGSAARFSDRIVSFMGAIRRGHPELSQSAERLNRWLRTLVRGDSWNRDPAGEFERWWPTALAHVGESLLRDGRYADALRCFDESLKSRGRPEIYIRMRWAVALGLAGRLGEARRALAELRPLSGEYPEIELYAGALAADEGAPPARKPLARPARAVLARAVLAPSPVLPVRAGLPRAARESVPRAAEPERPVPAVKAPGPRKREDKDWWRDHPATKEPLRRILDLFREGRWGAGFEELDRTMGSSTSPAALAIAESCRAEPGRCAPVENAKAELARLNREGIGLFGAGDVEGAQRSFQKALDLHPRNLDALLNLAAVKSNRGELEAALKLYDEAVGLDPAGRGQLSDALSSRANVLSRLGRKAEAAADLKRALQAAPDGWRPMPAAKAELERLQGGKD